VGKYVVWIGNIQNHQIALVGKKAFDLNELNSQESQVPNGFVVITEAYNLFINNIKTKIDEQLNNLNINNSQAIEQAATRIQKLILSSQLPPQVYNEILEAYDSMNKEVHFGGHLKEFDFLKKGEKCPIAVRSSPSSEKKESLEKQKFITFLNVKGVEQLKRGILGCYASVFSTNNILKRLKDNFYHIHLGNAIIVQEMISGEKSGILYTSSPHRENTLEINTVWGLTKGLEDFKGDNYLLEKESNRILDITTERQDWGYYCGEKGKITKRGISGNRSLNQKLNASELIILGDLSLELEKRYERRLIVIFTFSDNKLWLLDVELGDFLDKFKEDYVQMEYKDELGESSSEQREEWIEVNPSQEEIEENIPETPLQRIEEHQEVINEIMEEEIPETQTKEREELNREIEEEYGEPQNEEAETEEVDEQPQNEEAETEEVDEQPQYEETEAEEVDEQPQNEEAETEEVDEQPQYEETETEEVDEQPQNEEAETEEVDEQPQYEETEAEEVEEVEEQPQNEETETEEVEEQPQKEVWKEGSEGHSENESEPETTKEEQSQSNVNNAMKQLEFEEKLKEQLQRYSNLYPHAKNALNDFAEEVKKIFKESL